MAGTKTQTDSFLQARSREYWQRRRRRQTIARARDAMAICIDGKTGSAAFGACFDHGDGMSVHVIFRQLIERSAPLRSIVRANPGFFPATERKLATRPVRLRTDHD